MSFSAEFIMPKQKFKIIKNSPVFLGSFLCQDFKFSEFALPRQLVTHRKVGIFLVTFIEIACALLCIPFIQIVNQHIVAIVIAALMLTSALVGLVAKLRLSYLALILVIVFNVPVLLGFYISLLYQYLSRQIAPVVDLVPSSLPLIIFILVNWHTIHLTLLVHSERSYRDNEKVTRHQFRSSAFAKDRLDKK